MIHRYTPHRVALRARKEIRSVAGILRDAPYQWHDVLEQARRGQLEVGFVHKGLDDLTHKLDVVFNRLVIALVVAGGLIGSSLIGIFAEERPAPAGPARDLARRVRHVRRARGLADDRRDPVRSVVDDCSSLRRKIAKNDI